MSFQPVPRQSVSDGVFAQLRAAVVDGSLHAGEVLPPERELAASFGVNRHAVREAIKRMQQAGLVEVVHGGGTHVLDFRRSAGLDVLAHLVGGGAAPAELLRSGLEMRRCVGVEAARLAAVRADDTARQNIRQAAGRYTEAGDDVDREFWAAVVDASDNIAFRLAFNSLLHAIDAHPDEMDVLLDVDRRDAPGHRALGEAIAAGDADGSAAIAHEILTVALTAVAALMAPSEDRLTRTEV